MINALHLLWIVPLCVSVGMFFASLARISADADRRTAELLRKE